MNEPIGRFGSASPERERITASATALHRFVLTDDATMQLVIEMQEFLLFTFEEFRERNARPSRDHLGDVLFIDLFLEQTAAFALFQAVFFAARSFSSCARRPYRNSATRLRSYWRSACSICALVSAICSRKSAKVGHGGLFGLPLRAKTIFFRLQHANLSFRVLRGARG